jgi:hypothetical protein
MERHRIDPLSFAIGGLLVAVGVALLTGSTGPDGRWILPVLLGLFAVALALGVWQARADQTEPVADLTSPEPEI